MTFEGLAKLIQGDAPPPSLGQIDTFERKLSFSLPADYRRFLGLTGGGVILGTAATYRDADDREEIVRRIGGVGPGGEVIKQVEQPDWHPVPRELLWFGSGAGGDPFALCLREDRLGQVFLIDHEIVTFEQDAAPQSLEDAEADCLAFYFAPSFTAFVTGLRTE